MIWRAASKFSIVLYDRLLEAAKEDQRLEETAAQSPYDPSAATLVADRPLEDSDPSGETHAPDDGKTKPGPRLGRLKAARLEAAGR